MMARKPMREKLMAQNDVAVMKEAIRPADRRWKSSDPRKYMPATASVPKIIDQSLRAVSVLPNMRKATAWRLIKRPSRP